ncbi:hypothetical protein LZ518_09975 [Sphingomonas sp. RB56-2]|uniref:Uncharacterized protein n=1 Tax=Sphingomonas brevis TaxID=2908206 RepID=A0ABT0SAT6_9SPHN|nr:hypothetical protein [Sphingomonas brevis]MCL6741458.1 hypothetical protein [Sphingomonas brevis]
MPANPPLYREAYPRLDIVKAAAAMERERPVCEFTNQNGNPKGWLLVEIEDGNRLIAMYDLFAEYFPSHAGAALLKFIPAPLHANPNRHLLICPKCERQLITLFYRGWWACGDCHRLGFRSQYVSREVRARENRFARWKQLVQQFENGKPHRMRQVTADRLLRERDFLRSRLSSEPRLQASEQHQPIITAEWIDIVEAERRHLIPRSCD